MSGQYHPLLKMRSVPRVKIGVICGVVEKDVRVRGCKVERRSIEGIIEVARGWVVIVDMVAFQLYVDIVVIW